MELMKQYLYGVGSKMEEYRLQSLTMAHSEFINGVITKNEVLDRATIYFDFISGRNKNTLTFETVNKDRE